MSFIDVAGSAVEALDKRAEAARFEALRGAAQGEAVVLDMDSVASADEKDIKSVDLRLRIWFAEGTAAEISRTTYRTEALRAVVGDVIPVRYDPSDRSRIEIDEPVLKARRESAEAEAIDRGKAELARRAAENRGSGRGEGLVVGKELTQEASTYGNTDTYGGCRYTLRIMYPDGKRTQASPKVGKPYHRAAIGDLLPVRHDKQSKIEIDTDEIDARWARAAQEKVQRATAELAGEAAKLPVGQALGIVLGRKATILGNLWDPTAPARCRYELLVGFPDGSITKASLKVTGAAHCRPVVGDLMPLRYDAAHGSKEIELDAQALEARQAADKAGLIARAEISIKQKYIPPSWILGRGVVNDVRKEPAGDLVKCTVTAAIRLVDGTAMYFATFDVTVNGHRAERIVERAVFTVRADPQDHSQVTISFTEPTPVVLVTDPELIDPPVLALRDGKPCRIVILAHARAFMKTPSGEERFASKVRVTSDGSELLVTLLVPEGEHLEDGIELPAKRLADQRGVVAIDWDQARLEAGQT